MSHLLNRRFFLFLMSLLFVGAMANAASVAKAAEIRFFVLAGRELFEVKGSTGGRFVVQPTRERIDVPGRGPIPVVGYTDRIASRETLVYQVRGTGRATVWITGNDGFRENPLLRPSQFQLPVVGILGPPLPMVSITCYVTVDGKKISRRLPIGTRP